MPRGTEPGGGDRVGWFKIGSVWTIRTGAAFDPIVLVGMVTMLDGGTRWGSVRVRDDRCGRRGRTIFLINDVFRFLCRQRRISVEGRQGTWDKIIKVRRSGCRAELG